MVPPGLRNGYTHFITQLDSMRGAWRHVCYGEGVEQLNWILPVTVLVISLCIHEYSHAWMAMRKGDTTARDMGRLTLNPIAHADFVGTFLLPVICAVSGGFIFGWAKPVPVDTRNLKNGRADMAWVAAAGPVSNLILAAISTLALSFWIKGNPESQTLSLSAQIFVAGIQLNILLAVFNILPIPPLDGFNVLQAMLPTRMHGFTDKIARYGFFILLALFFTGAINHLIAGPTRWVFASLIGIAEALAH